MLKTLVLGYIRMNKLLRGLLILFFCSIITNASFGEDFDILEASGGDWVSLTTNEKVILVEGIIIGAFGISAWSGEASEERLPYRQIRDYVIAIEWIYERPELFQVPIWVIVFDLENALNERRKYAK
jgi:hypothetical protein